MSSAVIIAIAVAAVVVLAAVALVTAARRSDVRGAGALSKETRQRDAGSAPVAAPTGREVERAAAATRGGLATVEAAPPVAWSPPDSEEMAVNRRQFLKTAAALAARAGGWQLTPLFTLGCCAGGAVLAVLAQRQLAAQSRHV